jgi:hypothetical protein
MIERNKHELYLSYLPMFEGFFTTGREVFPFLAIGFYAID